MTNEPLFERCPHDRQNPYVMISREMAQDKSISPKAKGVLLYLFSLPPDWKIYHSQLQQGLNVGEEYINSAMDELLANGYAERTRERVNGMFQPYRYKIREFKKCLPNGENRPGSTGPVNPVLQSKEIISTKETTTNKAAAPAVAAPLKQKEKQQPAPEQKVHPCLLSVDIPQDDKEWTTRNYSEDAVKYAVEWATHPQTKISTTLVQAIKWACSKRPPMPKLEQDLESENRQLAQQIINSAKVPDHLRLEILSDHVEIVYLRCEKAPEGVKYSEKGFLQQLKGKLYKAGCTLT